MSEMHDPYEDQLAAARYRAERDQARQECERLQRKAECLEDDIENLKLELGEAKDRLRDRSRDTTVSAYDLLPEEDRDAIAWVREHGGLERVKAQRRESIPRAAYERKKAGFIGHIAECETALGRRNQRIEELEERVRVRERANDELNEELNAMRPRLMPEGMEWPRFEDGAPVRPGDRLLDKGGDWFKAVSFVFTCDWWSVRGYQTEGFGDLNNETRRKLEGMAYGTCVNRPAPKVLDADGAEIRVGDTVYEVKTGDKFVVETIYHGMTEPDSPEHTVRCHKPSDITAHMFAPDMLTHRAPFLAVDDKPLLKGETVWSVDSGTRYTVEEIEDGLIPIKCRSEMGSTVSLHPSQLIHQRILLDADGVPVKDADTVWLTDGSGPWKVSRIVCADRWRVVCDDDENGHLNAYPEQLTHERPDTRARVIDGMDEETVERIDRLVKDGRWLDD